MDGTGTIENMTFLGKSISSKCLAKILGIGKARLKRGSDCVPDLRFGKAKNISHKETWSVDAFLAMQYESVAETLPDRPARFCHLIV